MMRRMKMAALAGTVMLALSGFALAQRDYDDDDGYHRRGDGAQARQYGYDNGYRDGLRRGQHEGRENDPFDYRTPDWRQATHGYKGWMGPIDWFQNGYQQGYRDGFQSGYDSVRGRWRDGDRDGYGRRDRSPAYDIGYQDGRSMAREDWARGKRFNSNPRGPYDDKDHGYRREYGDKRYYKDQYAEGYRQGYEAGYR